MILVEQGVQLGLGEDCCYLGGEGDEERFFVFIKLMQFVLLDYQYVQQLVVLNDWYVKEGVEVVFFDGGDIFEVGVFLCIGEVDGFCQVVNQFYQVFIECQCNGVFVRFF